MGLFKWLSNKSRKKQTHRSTLNISWVDAQYETEPKKQEQILLRAKTNSLDNPIDLHFTYNHLISLYYKQRDSWENAIDNCIKYCLADIELYPYFRDASISDDLNRINDLKGLFDRESKEYHKYENETKDYRWIPPHIPSFKRLSIIYEKQGKYTDAIQICKLAIYYNLTDDTKGGFENRIERLKKKIK